MSDYQPGQALIYLRVSKNQHKRHVGQGKLTGVSQSYVLDCYTNSKKFSVEFFFFDKRGIAKSVVNEHFNGKLFFQILNTECVAGYPASRGPSIFLLSRKIEGPLLAG